jgi:hypothetical protein
MSVKQLSREEFRRRYLETLKIESSNDAKNLAANQLFRDTGTPSQPVDTRTITEKVADIEGLKALLRSELNKITDSTSASQIVGQLDAEELSFAYEQFGTIERDISSRFRSGVPADIFIQYLRRLMEQFALTGGVPQTVAEAIEPVTESIKRSTIQKREAAPDATGDYETRLSLPTLDEVETLTKGQTINLWKRIKDELFRQLRDEEQLTQTQVERRREVYKRISASKARSAENIKKWIRENPEDWDAIEKFMSGIAGSGIQGRGLAKGSVRRRPELKIDSNGIQPLVYGTFGRYFVDMRKLDKGLASFKNNKGSYIGMGVKRVSTPVACMIKKITGGGMPDYDDINALSEDDRIYMSDLLGKAQLDTKIKIPNPAKSKMQRETDRFEVLKGQILSGNDSRELLKEFKILLLKLTKEGRIPKKECTEILMELMVIGL